MTPKLSEGVLDDPALGSVELNRKQASKAKQTSLEAGSSSQESSNGLMFLSFPLTVVMMLMIGRLLKRATALDS